ncbi:unnamed protein product [Rhizophagus irregularis]|nr:unnamed protein product [Rhizophagus irregularis]
MAIDSLLKVRDTLNWVDRTDNRDFISQPNSPILESEKRKDESGDKFKDVVQNKDIIDIDKPFCLYCEKILSGFYNLVDVSPTMNRKIGERKHIVYQVSALFKFYERTFLTLDIDWIESHSHSAKILKSESNSGDSKKTFQTDILNLILILREHLDCDMDHETKIKVFSTQSINNRLTLYSLNLLPNGHFLSCELASTVLPFSLSGRGQYKSVLRMMSIFHMSLAQVLYVPFTKKLYDGNFFHRMK